MARFSGGAVSPEQFRAQFESQPPFNRQRYASGSGKKELLTGLVRAELLALAAAKEGFDRDPEVVRELKRAMTSRYLARELDERAIRSGLTEQELREWFERHRGEYERPARVRASVILLAAADPAERGRKKAAAAQLLSELRAQDSKDPLAFASIARRRSEDPQTRASDGDMRFLAQEEMARQWGDEVAHAVFASSRVGLLDEVVESPRGFALLRIQNVDPAVTASFEQRQEEVRSRAAAEKRARLLEELLARLERERQVVIDEQLLESINLGG